MTSYRENRLNSQTKKLQFLSPSVRILNEHSHSLKKDLEICLLFFIWNVLIASNFVITCCVLHNICLLKNDDLTMAELDLIQDNYNLQSLMKGRNRHIGQVKEIISVMNLVIRNM